MNFIKFLESRLLNEMTNEMDFIKSFLLDFSTHTLLVFADWLQEHDDPREALVRNSVKNNLNKNAENEKMANSLGIKTNIPFKGEGTIAFNGDGEFYIFDMNDFNFYVYKGQKGIEMLTKKVEMSKIPDLSLSKFFWSIIGYGI